jgi:hypothetical protein
MKRTYDINDIGVIEQLYMDMDRSSVDILYIVEEAKKLYAKSYIERLSTTKDKIGQIISVKITDAKSFSLDGIAN